MSFEQKKLIIQARTPHHEYHESKTSTCKRFICMNKAALCHESIEV